MCVCVRACVYAQRRQVGLMFQDAQGKPRPDDGLGQVLLGAALLVRCCCPTAADATTASPLAAMAATKKEGYLIKQGAPLPFPVARSLLAHLTRPHACVSGHIFRTWKERWFVLDGPLLKYYKSSESSEGRQSGQPGQLELKGSVTLPDCEVDVLPAAEAGGRQHAGHAHPLAGPDRTCFRGSC